QLFLSLDWEGDEATQKGKLEEINKVIVSHAAKGDLRRYDIRESMLSATYLVDLRDDQSLSGLVDSLREEFPDISITFLDQNHLPSV
ncbi:MAG: short-subunit dehydrogenase involved in D-alanine esterification of teichoic acids, partial [Gammaproteobacteria bacterium]